MVKRAVKRAEPASWAVFILCLVALWVPDMLPHFGRLEGRISPVLSPQLTITASAPRGTETVLSGHATKRRGACRYVSESLRWYLGDPDGLYVPAPAHFEDPPTVRAEGVTEWSGIVVGLTGTQIASGSFATVQHRCGWPWPTESRFFTSGR